MRIDVRPHATVTPESAVRDAERRGFVARSQTLAGVLLSLSGMGIILSIITNEALYPVARHYSTFGSTISDLSGTEPPHSYMVQPNRLIFIVTMALAGALVLGAAYLLWRVDMRRRFLVALTVFGIGLVGIAIFPGNVATYHPIFALLCFLGGSIAAILSRAILVGPARHFAVCLGSVALVSTALGLDAFATWWPQSAIGIGGVERWIAYPVLLWLVMLGGILMAAGSQRRSPCSA